MKILLTVLSLVMMSATMTNTLSSQPAGSEQNALWLGPIKAWDRPFGGEVQIFGSFEVRADPSKPLRLIIRGESESSGKVSSKSGKLDRKIQLTINKQQYEFKDLLLFTRELNRKTGNYAFTIEGTAVLVQEGKRSNEQEFILHASGKL